MLTSACTPVFFPFLCLLKFYLYWEIQFSLFRCHPDNHACMITYSNLRPETVFLLNQTPVSPTHMAYCILWQNVIFIPILIQCPKLRVHPAPGAHIFTAGCTIFGGVHPACARFLSHLLYLHIMRVHGEITGRTFLGEVHPVGAPNKILISDTAYYPSTYVLQYHSHNYVAPLL